MQGFYISKEKAEQLGLLINESISKELHLITQLKVLLIKLNKLNG